MSNQTKVTRLPSINSVVRIMRGVHAGSFGTVVRFYVRWHRWLDHNYEEREKALYRRALLTLKDGSQVWVNQSDIETM